MDRPVIENPDFKNLIEDKLDGRSMDRPTIVQSGFSIRFWINCRKWDKTVNFLKITTSTLNRAMSISTQKSLQNIDIESRAATLVCYNRTESADDGLHNDMQ